MRDYEFEACQECHHYGEPSGCNNPTGTCGAYEMVLELRAEVAKHKQNKPVCPDCGAVTVKTHIELDDGSGWITCWTCECEYKQAEKEAIE